MSEHESLTPRVARFEEILPLRDAVIIKGTNRVSPEFDGDHDATTIHMGIFVDGRAVCCGSFYPRAWEGRAAWQLRGMATDPAYQGKGLGKRLLAFAEAHLAGQHDAVLLWCNARSTAVRFYEQQGWTVESEPFEVEGVGPHVKMVKMAKVITVTPYAGSA